MLLLARHANPKSESIVIILFLLPIFSVFIMKTCTDLSPTFSEQAQIKRKKEFELKYLFIYTDFVGNNTKMTQVGFQTELLYLVWR